VSEPTFSEREANAWEYVPGLLELADEGLEPSDLSGREFVAPQVRSGGAMGGELTPEERTRLERMWDWLRGFRRAETLVERLPAWAPIAEVWPAPGGAAEFSYSTAAERELQAELSVVAVGGFGGASRRTLTSAVRLEAGEAGLSYETRVFVTVHRYEQKSTGQALHRIDVDTGGETGEFRPRDLPLAEHPFDGRSPTLDELRSAGRVVVHIERCADRAGDTERRLGDESLRSWQFSLGLDALPGMPVTLSASCRRTRAFQTTFTLPGGRDYAFCTPIGQAPVVPLCVALAVEGTDA
jgi:hypothetical protein